MKRSWQTMAGLSLLTVLGVITSARAEDADLPCNALCRRWMRVSEPAPAQGEPGPALRLAGAVPLASDPEAVVPYIVARPTRPAVAKPVGAAVAEAARTIPLPARRPADLRSASQRLASRPKAAVGPLPVVLTPAPAPPPPAVDAAAAWPSQPVSIPEPTRVSPDRGPLLIALASPPSPVPFPAPARELVPTREPAMPPTAFPAASHAASTAPWPPAFDVIASVMLGTPPR